MPLNILIIDDDEGIGLTYKNWLAKLGMEVRFAISPEEGLMLMRYTPDIVLLDYWMPRMNGIEVLQTIRQSHPDQIVIMMTAHGSIEIAVKAMKHGAFHYIPKPFKIDELVTHINKAREIIEMRNLLNLTDPAIESGDFGLLDGKSAVMKAVYKRAKKVADTPRTSVLVLGENGTGKEMLARTIHKISDRKDGAFVALNCSAIPSSLFESEVFGCEAGSYTDATVRRKGAFEVADGGTIFLDEIGDMPLAMQAKILRTLQDSAISRLGGENEMIHVDVRVIAASNKNLQDMIKEGTFREDLYFRLNTFTMELPPLRERENDVIGLAIKCIHKYNKELKKNIAGLSPEVARLFKSFHWPGNVRQLDNTIQGAMIECEGDYIQIKDLSTDLFKSGSLEVDDIANKCFKEGATLEEVKRRYILKVIGECKTDQEAADKLDVSRRTITRFKKEIP